MIIEVQDQFCDGLFEDLITVGHVYYISLVVISLGKLVQQEMVLSSCRTNIMPFQVLYL